jgi:hypothetical protein
VGEGHVGALRFWTVGGCSYDELDELAKQERSKLDRLDELSKHLQNGSLDSGATTGIIEALEERKADYRVWLDECEKAKFALSEPIELPEA